MFDHDEEEYESRKYTVRLPVVYAKALDGLVAEGEARGKRLNVERTLSRFLIAEIKSALRAAKKVKYVADDASE